MEKELGHLENLCAPVVRQVNSTRTLPSHDSLGPLLDFVAMIACRTPMFRHNSVSMVNHFGKLRVRQEVEREGFRTVLRRISDGREPTEEELAKFTRFIQEGEYTVRPDQNSLVEMFAVSVPSVRFGLSDRHWSLLEATPDAPDFICGDHPAVLFINGGGPKGFVPGFRTPGTWLMMPLGRRVSLIGSLDGKHVRGPAPAQLVALVNTLMIDYSERFLFASGEEFCWLRQDHTVVKTAELVAEFGRQRAEISSRKT